MQCIVLPTKFGSHRVFLSNLTSSWPRLMSAWQLTLAMRYTFVRGFSCHIWWSYGISKQFYPWLTPGDPYMTFDPQQCITPWSGVLPAKFGSYRAFLRQLNIWMTFDLWWGRFVKLLSTLPPCQLSGQYLSTSEHDETHSRTYIQKLTLKVSLYFVFANILIIHTDSMILVV